MHEKVLTSKDNYFAMLHIRKDYIQEKLAIILPDCESKYVKCPLCPGNEYMTNLSLLSLVAKSGMLQRLQDSDNNYVKNWTIRIFESSNPVVSTRTDKSYSDRPFYIEPAYGYHYIVVATSKHEETFSTISVEQWSNIITVLQDRLKWLYTQKGVIYVSIYINHGKEAGDSLFHSHLNMITFSLIPPVIESEANLSHEILNEKGVCPMCHIINEEVNGARQILQTDSFIAFCPWSPIYPFEFWISPKKHTTSFAKITQKEIGDLSLILRSTLGGLSKCMNDPPYNLVFHLSPEKKNSKQIHWHIEVYPVTKYLSGLERGYGIFLNNTFPEQVAKVLGSTCRKELAELVGII